MPEPSPSGLISALWRFTLAILAAALVLNLAINTLRCAWPWIVGVGTFIAMVALVVRFFRNRGSIW